jgi:alkylation response protein AidB-like acyl-CoA dehydrogenase
MAYELSDDEALIERTIQQFAAAEIGLEAAADFDRHDRFPAEPTAKGAALGLTGMLVPAEAGGAEAGATALVLALDAVARVCPNTAAVLAVHNALGTRILMDAASDAELLRGLCGGQTVAVLATEEAYGSSKLKLGTAATPAGNGYRITGQKVWGLGAAGAKHFLVLAQVEGAKADREGDGKDGPTGRKEGVDGPTWFHIAADAPGVALGANEPLLGLRGSGIRTVYFSDVEVGADDVIGAVGAGRALHEQAMPWLQVAAAACLNGCTAGALEAAARFAEERVQFGKPIGHYQAVSDGLVDIDIQLAASRSLTRAAAAQQGQSEGAAWAARAKQMAARVAVEMTRRAIRMQGGTGFMREGVAERFARDARALQFLGEPEAVQKGIIKRHLLDLEFGLTP